MEIAVEIKQIPGKRLGVFATKNFVVGEIIESCPVIPLSPFDRSRIETTPLDNYVYPWKSEKDACVVLGYGSLINHAYDSNADWQPDLENERMNYVAVNDISVGEEITVNYNGHPGDKTPIDWFEVK